MRAGKLDHKITIERATETLDDFGTPVLAWTPIASLRAQVVEASTNETVLAHGMSAETGTMFRTRFIEGITPADRIVHAGRVHDIKRVKEIGRRRGLELHSTADGTE